MRIGLASAWYLNKGGPTLITLALLCHFTAQHVSDVNTSKCRLNRQPALEYNITNSQSRYITPTRLNSAQYSLHNNAPSSRKLLKMDVLTSETCWAVKWHNKASVIKVGPPLFKIPKNVCLNVFMLLVSWNHSLVLRFLWLLLTCEQGTFDLQAAQSNITEDYNPQYAL